MSKILTGPPAGFNPDVIISVKVDSKTGDTMVQAHNAQGAPMQANPVYVIQCLSVAIRMNAEMLMKAMNSAQLKGNAPHAFVALEGEKRCRVPGCGKIRADSIHAVQAPEVD